MSFWLVVSYVVCGFLDFFGMSVTSWFPLMKVGRNVGARQNFTFPGFLWKMLMATVVMRRYSSIGACAFWRLYRCAWTNLLQLSNSLDLSCWLVLYAKYSGFEFRFACLQLILLTSNKSSLCLRVWSALGGGLACQDFGLKRYFAGSSNSSRSISTCLLSKLLLSTF